MSAVVSRVFSRNPPCSGQGRDGGCFFCPRAAGRGLRFCQHSRERGGDFMRHRGRRSSEKSAGAAIALRSILHCISRRTRGHPHRFSEDGATTQVLIRGNPKASGRVRLSAAGSVRTQSTDVCCASSREAARRHEDQTPGVAGNREKWSSVDGSAGTDPREWRNPSHRFGWPHVRRPGSGAALHTSSPLSPADAFISAVLQR